jgi:hypothetical protein
MRRKLPFSAPHIRVTLVAARKEGCLILHELTPESFLVNVRRDLSRE